MAELLRALPHFNHRSDLIDAIVGRMSHRLDDVAGVACDSVAALFKTGADAAASGRAVKALVALVKAKGVRVRPEALRTLLSLPLSTATATRAAKVKKVKVVGEEGSDDEDPLLGESRGAEYAAALKDLLHIYFRLLRSSGGYRTSFFLAFGCMPLSVCPEL
jgi:hypothetical protein